MTRPKLRIAPSSSRWPKAWQPDAKPVRVLEQRVRAVRLHQAGLLVVGVAVDHAVRAAQRPDACTESSEVLILVTSRGGIWF